NRNRLSKAFCGRKEILGCIDNTLRIDKADENLVAKRRLSVEHLDTLRIEHDAPIDDGLTNLGDPGKIITTPTHRLVGFVVDTDAVATVLLGLVAGTIGGAQYITDIRRIRSHSCNADAAGHIE